MVLYYRTDLFKEMDIDLASLKTWENWSPSAKRW